LDLKQEIQIQMNWLNNRLSCQPDHPLFASLFFIPSIFYYPHYSSASTCTLHLQNRTHRRVWLTHNPKHPPPWHLFNYKPSFYLIFYLFNSRRTRCLTGCNLSWNQILTRVASVVCQWLQRNLCRKVVHLLTPRLRPATWSNRRRLKRRWERILWTVWRSGSFQDLGKVSAHEKCVTMIWTPGVIHVYYPPPKKPDIYIYLITSLSEC
jgi:hypothetical protein